MFTYTLPIKREVEIAEGGFSDQMRALFQSEPTGTLIIPTLNDALRRIEVLEKRLALLEKKNG